MTAPATSSAGNLSDKDFGRLASVIHKSLGIKMPLSKKLMLQSRLLRRMRALGLSSFQDYCDHVLSPEGESSEVVHLLDLATTNKTSFFREAEHFQYLTQHALPRLVQDPSVRARGRLRMWSAACSLGMEVYTLGMVVAEFLQKNGLGGWDFDILGTDISTKVLKAAKLGIYPEQDVASVPAEMRRKYFARGKGERAGTVRVLPGLRARVRFARVNLMAPLPASEAPMQVIMCRNALIYFERDGQTAIVDNLRKHLGDEGYLVLGMSETIHGYGLPLKTVHRSVYQHGAEGERG